jgi:hypothetical protein
MPETRVAVMATTTRRAARVPSATISPTAILSPSRATAQRSSFTEKVMPGKKCSRRVKR